MLHWDITHFYTVLGIRRPYICIPLTVNGDLAPRAILCMRLRMQRYPGVLYRQVYSFQCEKTVRSPIK